MASAEEKVRDIIVGLKRKEFAELRIGHQAAARRLKNLLGCDLHEITAEKLIHAQKEARVIERWFACATPREIAWAIHLAYAS